MVIQLVSQKMKYKHDYVTQLHSFSHYYIIMEWHYHHRFFLKLSESRKAAHELFYLLLFSLIYMTTDIIFNFLNSLNKLEIMHIYSNTLDEIGLFLLN